MSGIGAKATGGFEASTENSDAREKHTSLHGVSVIAYRQLLLLHVVHASCCCLLPPIFRHHFNASQPGRGAGFVVGTNKPHKLDHCRSMFSNSARGRTSSEDFCSRFSLSLSPALTHTAARTVRRQHIRYTGQSTHNTDMHHYYSHSSPHILPSSFCLVVPHPVLASTHPSIHPAYHNNTPPPPQINQSCLDEAKVCDMSTSDTRDITDSLPRRLFSSSSALLVLCSSSPPIITMIITGSIKQAVKV